MSTMGEERPLSMNREQIEAWLTLEGHRLRRDLRFFYCTAYGRIWMRYADYDRYEDDTWDDYVSDSRPYVSGVLQSLGWESVPYPALKQLYQTLVDYKENPT